MISPQTFFKLLAAASLLRTANSDVDSAAAAAAAAEATLYSRLRHINASCTPQSSSSSSSSSFYSRVERLALEALLSDDAPDLRRLRSLITEHNHFALLRLGDVNVSTALVDSLQQLGRLHCKVPHIVEELLDVLQATEQEYA